MKIFLDTADVAAVRRAHSTGLLNGVTTNPSHVAKTGRVFEDILQEICSVVPDHVSVEAVADSAEGLVSEARRLAAYPAHVNSIFETVPHAPVAHPVTHEKAEHPRSAMVGVGIGVAVAIAIGGHFDIDADSDPDILWFKFYFRNSPPRA